MRVNREDLLRVLESVSPGLATREAVEQSSCFVFLDGYVVTFNDEVAASRLSPLSSIRGAVPAKPLLGLLGKLPEDELDIEAAEGELRVKGKGRRLGIAMEGEVSLAISSVDVPKDSAAWAPLPPDFGEAVGVVAECASRDEQKFAITCIHVTPTHLEACDNNQIARYPLTLNIERDMLIRSKSLRCVVGLDMTEYAMTPAWMHFRNPAGLTISCRRFLEDYPNVDFAFQVRGHPASLPGGLAEAVGRAEECSVDNVVANIVVIDLKPGVLQIEGRGAQAWFQEKKEIVYQGEPVKFAISPKLLIDITKRTKDCLIAPAADGRPGVLFIDGGKFKFVSALAPPSV